LLSGTGAAVLACGIRGLRERLGGDHKGQQIIDPSSPLQCDYDWMVFRSDAALLAAMTIPIPSGTWVWLASG
jgi:hypothetical protein